AEYVRQRRMGGGGDDPVVRLVGTLSGLGAELSAIGARIGTLAGARGTAELVHELRGLRDVIVLAAKQTSADAVRRDPESWLSPRLDALAESLRAATETAHMAGGVGNAGGGIRRDDAEAILAQVRRIESSLAPVVSAVLQQREGDQVLANKMVQIIELLEQLDARLAR
ncbi:MAG TPA: hypothetical protein VN253_18535, partial [Kofleriaceae bacterium]|nr:hypothetical protein [Kofleriaceae bacterium]